MAIREASCMDCGLEFLHSAQRGPLPKRCRQCRDLKDAELVRVSYRRHRDKRLATAKAYWLAHSPRVKSTICQECGLTFEYVTGRGKHPKFCDLCRPATRKKIKSRYRERNRESLREKGRRYMAQRLEDDDFRARQRESIAAARQRDPAYASEIRRRSYRKNAEKRRSEAAARRAIHREAIYERDGGRCHICGRGVSRDSFHVDHLVPRSKGGTESLENLALTHPFCNQSRGAGRLPAQLRLVG